jgi:hypothetical protein
MTTIEEKKLEFEKEQFEFLKNRTTLQDILVFKMNENIYHYQFMKLAIILLLLIILVYYLFIRIKSENFMPYGSILAPEIINSTAGFDFPNLFNETTEPYQKVKDRTENKYFGQLHDLVGR